MDLMLRNVRLTSRPGQTCAISASRADGLRLLVHGAQAWQPVESPRDLSPVRLALTDEALTRAAEARDVDPATVVQLAEEVRRTAG